MKLRKTFFLFASFFLVVFAGALCAQSAERSFKHFAVNLPQGWDGDEQSGFISDDPNEYMLTLTRKDADEDRILGQVSIYFLPNKPGKNSRESALALTEAQGEATRPVQEGNFWTFTGEPRSSTIKGIAKTLVNASPERLLIIIAHDPDNGETAAILDNLRGLTPAAREMLGK